MREKRQRGRERLQSLSLDLSQFHSLSFFPRSPLILSLALVRASEISGNLIKRSSTPYAHVSRVFSNWFYAEMTLPGAQVLITRAGGAVNWFRARCLLYRFIYFNFECNAGGVVANSAIYS